MISQYAGTNQGAQTRSCILNHLSRHSDQEFSRDDLVQHCQLSYDQVRRQTKNLCIDGAIKSRLAMGRRLYRLASSSFLIVVLGGWGIAVNYRVNQQHGAYIQHGDHDIGRDI